jgi:ring-1,2-phenylacetyl-CoA epoxidase subunit PaaC
VSGAPDSGAPVADAVRFEYLLRLADTSLILGQRLGEWVGHAPALEEDLGFGNLALDFIGQARLLLSYAGSIEGRNRSEDDLAFLRDGPEFRNFTLVEQPNVDFGHTIVRQYFIDAYQNLLFDALSGSSDERLAGIAAKALKESQYHLRFSSNWLLRLGDGTAESHRRVQDAADRLIRFTPEFFESDALEQAAHAAGISPDLEKLGAAWNSQVAHTFGEATLDLPKPQRGAPAGKRGDHSENLGYILAEMQYMQRAYPGASW